jgi:hypothetical protein
LLKAGSLAIHSNRSTQIADLPGSVNRRTVPPCQSENDTQPENDQCGQAGPSGRPTTDLRFLSPLNSFPQLRWSGNELKSPGRFDSFSHPIQSSATIPATGQVPLHLRTFFGRQLPCCEGGELFNRVSIETPAHAEFLRSFAS